MESPRHIVRALLMFIEKVEPWLVWLSGLSAGLQTKGSPVRFLVRAHAWVAGQVPSGKKRKWREKEGRGRKDISNRKQ